EDWKTIRPKLQKLIIHQDKDPEHTYSTLINQLQDFIVTVCDNSKLILDPEITSYYLMSTYCEKLPAFSEDTSLIQTLGFSAIKQKKLTPINKNKLGFLSESMNSISKPEIQKNIEKIIKTADSPMNSLENLSKQLGDETSAALNLLNENIL